jgi:hypothetical protein
MLAMYFASLPLVVYSLLTSFEGGFFLPFSQIHLKGLKVLTNALTGLRELTNNSRSLRSSSAKQWQFFKEIFNKKIKRKV